MSNRKLLTTYVKTQYLLDKALKPASEFQIQHSVKSFGKFLKRQATIADLTDNTVSQFVVWLEPQYAPWTVKRRRTDILSIWRHAADHDYRKLPLPRRVRKVMIPRHAPEAWTPEVVALLIGACRLLPTRRTEPDPPTYFEALIRAAWDTGLRRSDLWRFPMRKVANDGSACISMGKTGHVVRVQLRPETMAALRKLGGDFPLAWPHAKRYFYVLFQKLKDLAGVTSDGSMQRIRRSAATNVELHSPGHASKFLGHLTPGLASRFYIDPLLAYPAPISPSGLDVGQADAKAPPSYGEKLRLDLHALGIMDREFAERAGMGDKYLSQIIHGHTRGGKKTRAKIAATLKALRRERRRQPKGVSA